MPHVNCQAVVKVCPPGGHIFNTPMADGDAAADSTIRATMRRKRSAKRMAAVDANGRGTTEEEPGEGKRQGRMGVGDESRC